MADEYEITYAGARAVITATGATLRVFEVDGVSYVETFPADEPAPMGAGAILIPWPNRTAGAAWTHDGQPRHLAVSEPARGNAIHGLVRKETWSATVEEDSSVTLELTVGDRPGWPFRFRTTVTYALDVEGLAVTHTVHNLADELMPFGVGAHPYPRPGRADADDCVLTLAATTHLPLDPHRMVPAGPAVPDDTFADGKPLRGTSLDDAFGACVAGLDGLVRHSLRGAGGGVELWADPVFGWVQVYTPESFPGKESGRAVAIEPMTCPPDALNSGIDLLHVRPRETWSASWGLRPIQSIP